MRLVLKFLAVAALVFGTWHFIKPFVQVYRVEQVEAEINRLDRASREYLGRGDIPHWKQYESEADALFVREYEAIYHEKPPDAYKEAARDHKRSPSSADANLHRSLATNINLD